MRITLATLHEATAQQVFDQVATHLLAQGKESMHAGMCKYRHRGLMCAAGCLIGDDEYNAEKMESFNWSKLVRDGLVPNDYAELIYDLQVIHDANDPRWWAHRLRDVARDYNLNTDLIPKEAE